MKQELNEAKQELNDLQQYTIRNNVVIMEFPKINNNDLKTTFNTICKEIGISDHNHPNVTDIFQSKPQSNNAPVILRFNSLAKINKIKVKQCGIESDKKLFIAEQLTAGFY